MAKNSQLVGGELVGYFTSVAEYLILGLLRTNPADGHGRLELGPPNDKSSTLTTRPRLRNKQKQEKEK